MPKIAELYQQHAASVYWSAYSITHNDSTAMDIMQSVFLRALEHEGTVSCLAPAQARGWLFTTARNASIDLIRKRKHELIAEDLPEPETADEATLPEPAVLSDETRRAVYAAVDSLPEKYRMPILLYYFAEMQQSEIAAYLELNGSTLRSLLRRAKAQLAKTLQEGGVLRGE